MLNISPSLRHAHNPKGDEPGLAQPVPGTRSEVIKLGSWGAQVVDEINPGDRDVQIVKHRFSAFWDTETDAVLRNLGVKTLFIGGVNMDQCVMTTLEDASFLGYDTVLIEDGDRDHLAGVLRASGALQREAPVRIRRAFASAARGACRVIADLIDNVDTHRPRLG